MTLILLNQPIKVLLSARITHMRDRSALLRLRAAEEGDRGEISCAGDAGGRSVSFAQSFAVGLFQGVGRGKSYLKGVCLHINPLTHSAR